MFPTRTYVLEVRVFTVAKKLLYNFCKGFPSRSLNVFQFGLKYFAFHDFSDVRTDDNPSLSFASDSRGNLLARYLITIFRQDFNKLLHDATFDVKWNHE